MRTSLQAYRVQVFPSGGTSPLEALYTFTQWVQALGSATYGVAYQDEGSYTLRVYGELPSPQHFKQGEEGYRYGEGWTALVSPSPDESETLSVTEG